MESAGDVLCLFVGDALEVAFADLLVEVGHMLGLASVLLAFEDLVVILTFQALDAFSLVEAHVFLFSCAISHIALHSKGTTSECPTLLLLGLGGLDDGGSSLLRSRQNIL